MTFWIPQAERIGTLLILLHGVYGSHWVWSQKGAAHRTAAPALQSDAKMAIAGLSMGGYGALRLGAKYASRFSAIAAHSAITNIDDLAAFVEEPLSEYVASAPRDELEALYWIKRNRARLPPLQFDCGVADKLIDSNRALPYAAGKCAPSTCRRIP